MKQVSQDEFYSVMCELNVHPHPIGKYPYEVVFKDPSGKIHGRCKDVIINGLVSTDYWIREKGEVSCR
jgi:hypothetical protein